MSSQVSQCQDKPGKECKEIWALQASDAHLHVKPEEIQHGYANAKGKEALKLRIESMELSESAHTKGLQCLGPELSEFDCKPSVAA